MPKVKITRPFLGNIVASYLLIGKSKIMNFISDALNRVQPSATVRISQKARAMRNAGHDVISLSAGEPDFDTPQYIKDAACKAIEGGKTKYTNIGGIIELRQAIAKKFKRDNDLDVSPENCFVSTGGKQIIFNVMMATLNKGDEVIIPIPYWVSYPEVVRFCDAKPVFVNTDAASSFKISPQALEDVITDKTKWLLLNSPSNPSGAVYTRDDLKALADVLKKYPHVWILSDDIYEQLVYNGAQFATIAQVEPSLMDRTLTMNGLSKSHAMTGWRIGYCTAPPVLIKQMAKLQSQSTSATCSIAQWAAVAALNGDQNFLEEWRNIFEQRRNILVHSLNEIDGIDCPKPNGAFYVFPSIKNLIGKTSKGGKKILNDEDFVMALLEEADVAVVHGSAFGMAGYIRISYAASTKQLTQAMMRIKQFATDLS